ncbi:hypothetical protein KP509_35G015800 [Ceratopteris richardii]|uniref:phenylalanine--tRNA ligase n=2 Tax=Ceratopteris richardii TaxID=49495 RepID=A0A8T2QFG0_CERRI|nr:hypothetical protein KP509_35G015800 [Ceratopteris richardii]
MAESPAEDAVLKYLLNHEEIPNSEEFAISQNIDHNELLNVIKSLNGFGFIEAKDIKKEFWVLTEEGDKYATTASPEVQVFEAVPVEGIRQDQLEGKLDKQVFSIGKNFALKNRWLSLSKEGGVPFYKRTVERVEDAIKAQLLAVKDGKDIQNPDALKKRTLIKRQTWKGFAIRKGANYAPQRSKPATDLTRDLLQNYEEMPTNNFVESSFWNFDTLFQPQQHPARDSHDTFFLKVPEVTQSLPENYLEHVKTIHEVGGHESIGYGYDWKREEAEKNLLRTHTTAVSSRMLYALAQGKFSPKKYFSIDRVFRNEAVDRTHLAEFHQIEGLICDRGLTLGDLMGVLNEFFQRLGMKKLRFKPAYNPYTEPSMEIFSYFDMFNKWVEVGNSGMIRPEVLRPMGMPKDVSVIAWGLSLERPTMILYGIDNIRDLFGHKVDLKMIESNPICRLGRQV